MSSARRFLGALGLAALLVAGCSHDPTRGAAGSAGQSSTASTAPPVSISVRPTTRPGRTSARPTPAPSSSAVEPAVSTSALPTADASIETSTLPAVVQPTDPPSTEQPATTPPPPPPSAPAPVELPTPEAPPADPNAFEARGTVGSIEIPRLGVSKPLFEGVTLTTLNKGPGHWPGTALPGQPGNVVVGGHRVSHDRPFRNVDQLVAGDEVIFTTAAGRYVYLVVGTEIVTPDAIRIINQTPAATATLFACTPPGSTSHRIVIHLDLAQ